MGNHIIVSAEAVKKAGGIIVSKPVVTQEEVDYADKFLAYPPCDDDMAAEVPYWENVLRLRDSKQHYLQLPQEIEGLPSMFYIIGEPDEDLMIKANFGSPNYKALSIFLEDNRITWTNWY